MRRGSGPAPRRTRARLALRLAALALALTTGGCLYGFSGGGGLPDHIQTVYVPPVENDSQRFALTERVTQGLLDAVRGRLGGQTAAEEQADAVIRVTLTRYRDEALSFEAEEDEGAQVFQRRVTISASVEIEDRVQDRVLWSSSSVRGSGEYAPEEETDEAGVEVALEDLIQKVVDGAQAQW